MYTVNPREINEKILQIKTLKNTIKRGQTAEGRTRILQPVEQKPHSEKDRQDEKEEG